MTAPSGGTARTVVVRRGQPAALITEYAPSGDDGPLTVINIGTERVWLSNDSLMPSGGGVPLEGGTSLPWTAGGTLYVVADAANKGDVTLVLSTAVESWEPSPYAVAAATAAALLASGIPLTQNSTMFLSLTNQALTAKSWASPRIDLAGNQSVTLQFSPNTDFAANQWFITLAWSDAAGNTLDVRTLTLYSAIDMSADAVVINRLQARSRYLQITVTAQNTAATFDLALLGYTGMCNRDTARMIDHPLLYQAPDIPAGGTVNLYCGPSTDQVGLYDFTAAPVGTMTISLWTLLGTGEQPFAVITNSSGGTLAAGDSTTVPVPFGCSLRLQVTNHDNVTRTPTLSLVDCS